MTPKKMIPCEQKETIQTIKENFGLLQSDITAIKNALLGDEYHPSNGLVNKVKDIDERLIKVERFQYKILTWSLVIVAIATVAFKVIEHYI